MGVYGSPRATGDIDLWIAADFENGRKVIEVIHEFGYDVPELKLEEVTTPNRIVRMGVPPHRIEVLSTLSGVEFEGCYAKRRVTTIDGVEVPVISYEDLLTNKAAAGRLKDLMDLEALRQL